MDLFGSMKARIEAYVVKKGLAKGVKAVVSTAMGLLGSSLANPHVMDVLAKAKTYGVDIQLNNAQIENALTVLFTALGAMAINFVSHGGHLEKKPE